MDRLLDALFNRFPVLQGWHQKDVLTIWAISASGFGIAATIFGNTFQSARANHARAAGCLDVVSRLLLPHLALGKMVPSATGDAIFGYVLFIAFVRPDLSHFALFVLFTITAAIVFTAVFLMAGSLSFFVGNAEVLAEQWIFSVVTFSTYPATLFEGGVKICFSRSFQPVSSAICRLMH